MLPKPPELKETSLKPLVQVSLLTAPWFSASTPLARAAQRCHVPPADSSMLSQAAPASSGPH